MSSRCLAVDDNLNRGNPFLMFVCPLEPQETHGNIRAKIIGNSRVCFEGDDDSVTQFTMMWTALSQTCRMMRVLAHKRIRRLLLKASYEQQYNERVVNAVDEFLCNTQNATLSIFRSSVVIDFADPDAAYNFRDCLSELFVELSGVSPLQIAPRGPTRTRLILRS